MGQIIKIYGALLNRKEKVCTKQEIIEILDEYNKKLGKINSENALKYLSRHNYIKRILLHYYYLNSLDEKERGFCIYEDKELLFIVLNNIKLNNLHLKWYLGMNSALYQLGKTWQTQNSLTIINNKISSRKNILGIKVKFVKIKENLIFGLISSSTRNNVPYFYSDLAKTYLDLAYFRKALKSANIKELNEYQKTKQYLKKYPKWLKLT